MRTIRLLVSICVFFATVSLFAQDPGTVKWSFRTNGTLKSCPAIGQDGTIYITSNDNKLYAINSDGKLKWTFPTKANIISSPVVGPDSTIYVGSGDYNIYAIKQDGSLKWSYKINSQIEVSPAVGTDGTIYIGANDNRFYAIKSDGTLRWSFLAQGAIRASASIGTDGTIYFGCLDKKLYACSPEGSLKWTFETKSMWMSSPAIGYDGTVYLGSSDNYLYAINVDGSLKWAFKANNIIRSSPVVAADGTIYVGAADNYLYALDPEGKLKWSYKIANPENSSPAIGSDSTIYLASSDNNLYAIEADGSLKWSCRIGLVMGSSPVIDENGDIYIGTTNDYSLKVITSDSKGPAKSAWPMSRKDISNRANGNNPNCPLTVIAKDSLRILQGDKIALDGSASFDPDGDPLFYLWRVIKKPAGSSLTLRDSTASATEVVFSTEYYGTYVFSLTVSDKIDGASSRQIVVEYGYFKWDYKNSKGIISSPTIGADGSIYYLDSDQYLYSLKSDGNLKWKFTSDGAISSRYVVVGVDGTIFVSYQLNSSGNNSSKLCAVDTSGTLKWSVNFDDSGVIASAIDLNGTIYVAANHSLFALAPDGSIVWSYNNDKLSFSTLSVGIDGTIYFTTSGSVGAISSDGKFEWEYRVVNPTALAIGSEATIYFGSYDRNLYALWPNGSKKWSFDAGKSISSQPVIGKDDIIYFGSDNSDLNALDADGRLCWSRPVDGKVKDLAIDSDGVILATVDVGYWNRDNFLYAFRPDGDTSWVYQAGQGIIAPTIADDGTVIITDLYKIQAIQTRSKGLASSAWPKPRKDIFGRGCVHHPGSPVAVVSSSTLSVRPGEIVRLDGGSSYDPNRDALSFRWHVVEKPMGTVAQFTDSSSNKTELTIQGSTFGKFRISLTVTDNKDGVSSASVNIHYAIIKWKSDAAYMNTPPAIGKEGVLYCASSDYKLNAINPDGSLKWAFAAGDKIESSAAIGSDGTIYFGSNDNHLYCLNTDGSLAWKYDAGNSQQYAPAVSSDGTIYVVTNSSLWENDYIHALTQDGTLKWKCYVRDMSASPSVAFNGKIYISGGYHEFVALDTDGKRLWSFEEKEESKQIMTSAAFSYDGTIYFTHPGVRYYAGSGKYDWFEGRLYALNPEGTLKWSYKMYDTESSPAIGEDGTLYCGSDDKCLYAIYPDGSLKWKFETGDMVKSSPTIDSNGKIYFGSNDKKLYCLNSDGSVDWVYETASTVTSTSLAPDGTLYFCDDGYLFAFATGSSGLANSPWPKYRRDNQNSSSGVNPHSPEAIVSSDTLYISQGQVITLDGSASFDPDDDPLTFKWRVIDKPTGSSLRFSDSTASITSVNLTNEYFGEYTFLLTVSDYQDGYDYKIIFVKYDNKKWEFQTNGKVLSSPAIGPDGTIYIGSSDRHLYALSQNGEEKWSYQASAAVDAAPALAADGTVYFSSSDRKLYSLNPDGSEKWIFIADGSIRNSSAIGSDGTIYFGSDNKGIHALNPDGSKKWSYQSESYFSYSPTIGVDGSIYCSDSYNTYSFYPDGRLNWKIPIKSTISPAVDFNGNIYIGNSDNYLYALNPDGTFRWIFTAKVDINTTPAIDVDGNLYFGAGNKYFYSINNKGELNWIYELGTGDNYVYSSPVIGNDSTIYFGSDNSFLYALSRAGELKWAFETDGPVKSSASIGSDGTLLFGSGDENLYALQTRSHGLTNSGSPKFRRDLANTGNHHNVHCPKAVVKADSLQFRPGETIVLDGSASFDPDGNNLTFLWRIAAKPKGSTVFIADSTAQITDVKLPPNVFGTYRFSFTVTDGKDGSSSASVYVFYNNLEWVVETGRTVLSSPAFANEDSTIYLGLGSISGTSSSGNAFAAFNLDGSLKWSFQPQGYVDSSPAIGLDHTIYFTSSDDYLYALNPDGSPKWSYPVGGDVQSSPAIGPDGAVYIGFNKGVKAINPNGTPKWVYQLDNPVITPVGVGQDSTIYFSTSSYNYTNNIYYALNSDGTLKWAYKIEQLGYRNTAPAISSERTVYFGSYLHINKSNVHRLTALAPDGLRQWYYDAKSFINNPPAIAADGTVYFGDDSGMFYALNPEGEVKWTINTGAGIASSPVIGPDGTIYFGSVTGILYALTPNGDILFSYQTDSSINSTPLLTENGTLVFVSSRGLVHALKTKAGKGLWPKFQCNDQNTGALPLKPVIAFFQADSTNGKIPHTVHFTDRSRGNIVSWNWDFGDGITSQEQNPVHTYSKAGSYRVGLTVTGPEGSSQRFRQNYINVNSGGLAGNVSGVWKKENSPVLISGDIQVPVNGSLVIEPGVQVIFDVLQDSLFEFNILGKLLARGTETDSISFRASMQSSNPTSFWRGIRFLNVADSCLLEHVSIGNANVGIHIFVTNQGNHVAVNKCKISSSRFQGILIEGTGGDASNCIISNSVILRNGDDGIFCRGLDAQEGSTVENGYANAIITNNIVSHNAGYGIHCKGQSNTAQLYSDNDPSRFNQGVASPRIENNLITANGSGGIRCNAEGFFMGFWGYGYAKGISEPLILKNLIYGNSKAGIEVQGSTPDIITSLISTLMILTPEIYNNTFWNNDGIDLKIKADCDSTGFKIINNIFAQSDTCIFKYQSTPDPILSHNNFFANVTNLVGFSALGYGDHLNMNNTPSDKFFNISEDPSFKNETEGDFGLNDSSSSIDAGTDIGLPFSGKAPDLGAFEAEQSTGIGDERIDLAHYYLFDNFPNPFNPSTNIRFVIPEKTQVTLDIINIQGRKVRELLNNSLQEGVHSVSWDGKNSSGIQVASGLYFYRLKTVNYSKVKFMVLVK